jgi:hypothetical protein
MMRSTGRLCSALAGAAILFGGIRQAHAETLTFDDLNPAGDLSNGYGGFNWSNFSVLDSTTYDAGHENGYANGTVSTDYVAYNLNSALEAVIGASSSFTFNSAYFTGAWNNGLTISVTGLSSSNVVDQTSITVDSTAPTLETFNWTGVDTVEFTSSGGTNAGYNGSGEYFAMDNFRFNEPVPDGATTPLPSTAYAGLGLLGGLGCWMLARRRKVVAE